MDAPRYELRLWSVLPRMGDPARFAPDARGHLTLVGTHPIYGFNQRLYEKVWNEGWAALSYTIGYLQMPGRFMYNWQSASRGNPLSVVSAFSIVAYDEKDGQPNYEHFTHIRSMWAPSDDEEIDVNDTKPVKQSGDAAIEEHRQMEIATSRVLAEVYKLTSDQVHMDFGEMDAENRIDDAADAAISLIVDAGFDSEDSDLFGTEMSETVQTLLMVVMLRCPQLADRIMGRDDDVKIVAVES